MPRRPDSGGVRVQSLTPDSYGGYLLSANDPAFGGDDAGHLILGAQPRRITTRGRIGQAWPVRGERPPDPELKLSGGSLIRRAAVGSADAIVVRAAPYPAGGVHGGHLVLLWNAGGRGQLVSLHFTDAERPTRYPERARIEAAIRIAGSGTRRVWRNTLGR